MQKEIRRPGRKPVKIDETYINQLILFIEHKENGEIKYFDVDNDFDAYYGNLLDLILDY